MWRAVDKVWKKRRQSVEGLKRVEGVKKGCRRGAEEVFWMCGGGVEE